MGGTARKIGKYQNTVLQIDETLKMHLDPFIISHSYLKLHPSSVFICLQYVCTVCPCILFIMVDG